MEYNFQEEGLRGEMEGLSAVHFGTGRKKKTEKLIEKNE